MILYQSENTPIILGFNGETFPLPGIVQSININGEIVFDSDNYSYSIQDYKDNSIQISLILLNKPSVLSNKTSLAYKDLKWLNQLFHKNKEIKEAVIFDITHEHFTSRGIHKIIFTQLKSSENSSKDMIEIQLEFREVQNIENNTSEDL